MYEVLLYQPPKLGKSKAWLELVYFSSPDGSVGTGGIGLDAFFGPGSGGFDH